MTDLEKKMIDVLKETCEGFPTVYYDDVCIKDMTRDELELLCTLFAHQSMLSGSGKRGQENG